MKSNKTGVLVMSYGTPESLDQVEAYYTHIRRGRPPSEQQLSALIERYEAIVGGFFPLRMHTDLQVEALERRLNEERDEYICFQGLKHARPYIEDGVEAMVGAGVEKAVGIVLAPHYSKLSVGTYIDRAQAAAEALGVQMRFVENYHLHPKLLQALCIRVEEALGRFKDVPREQIQVLFSAHSLPESIMEHNDPYPEQLLETSRAIAAQTGVVHWTFSWQSAGNTPVKWLGPDVIDVLRGIAEQGERRHVIVCPIGFVSDHLEVLYDIDIECQALCHELGLQLERTASLNTDPLYIETLADAVRSKRWSTSYSL